MYPGSRVVEDWKLTDIPTASSILYVPLSTRWPQRTSDGQAALRSKAYQAAPWYHF